MTAALLVDDDEQLLASVEAVSSAPDLDLLTASSWDEGLALFHVLSPDVVIADYNMPGSRHGLQLLARIRRARPSVRLILMSGYLDADDMAKVQALDLVDRTLTKGSAVETAREIVNEVRLATAHGDQPTDWRRYAGAFVSASAVSESDLDALDAILGKKVDEAP